MLSEPQTRPYLSAACLQRMPRRLAVCCKSRSSGWDPPEKSSYSRALSGSRRPSALSTSHSILLPTSQAFPLVCLHPSSTLTAIAMLWGSAWRCACRRPWTEQQLATRRAAALFSPASWTWQPASCPCHAWAISRCPHVPWTTMRTQTWHATRWSLGAMRAAGWSSPWMRIPLSAWSCSMRRLHAAWEMMCLFRSRFQSPIPLCCLCGATRWPPKRLF
mmetsp:Transcript_29772/g.88129  ORF Transcript_29772/g.88129 Transcript_29772/m.88129 type:complete len:218 (+) Transcript_29772:926-1579(+)